MVMPARHHAASVRTIPDHMPSVAGLLAIHPRRGRSRPLIARRHDSDLILLRHASLLPVQPLSLSSADPMHPGRGLISCVFACSGRQGGSWPACAARAHDRGATSGHERPDRNGQQRSLPGQHQPLNRADSTWPGGPTCCQGRSAGPWTGSSRGRLRSPGQEEPVVAAGGVPAGRREGGRHGHGAAPARCWVDPGGSGAGGHGRAVHRDRASRGQVHDGQAAVRVLAAVT